MSELEDVEHIIGLLEEELKQLPAGDPERVPLRHELAELRKTKNLLLEAGKGKPVGPQTRPDLQARLGRLMTRVDPRVVQDLIRFCAPQLPFADDTLLLQLYQSVAATPHSSTKAFFQRKDGLVFNGPYSSGMLAQAVLLIAFQQHTKPLLAKFTVDPVDIEHEYRVLSRMSESPPVPGIVGPVQLIRCNGGDVISSAHGGWHWLEREQQRLRGDAEAIPDVTLLAGPSIRARCAMVMPLYPATLQHVPCPMDPASLLRCGQQLRHTLTCIHSKGYGHNDVKASNVFLDSEGNCILGDFGAAQQLGAVPRECTNTHWPAELNSDTADTITTSVAADLFLLAVTLLERAGVHQLCHNPNSAMLQAATERLDSSQVAGKELRDFVLQLLGTGAAGPSGSGQQEDEGQGQGEQEVIAERRQVIKAAFRALVEAAQPDLSPAQVDAVVAQVNQRMTMGSMQCCVASVMSLTMLLQSFLGQPTPGFPAAGPAPCPPPPPDPACPPYSHPRLPTRRSPRSAAPPAQLPPPVQLDIEDPNLLPQIKAAMDLLTNASVQEHMMRGPHHRGIRLLPGEVATFEQPAVHGQLPSSSSWTRVETDGVSVSVHFVRSQAVHEPVELPFIGRELTATSDYSPATHIAVGVDPGVTQAIKAAHAMRDPATGQVLRQWEWELTKGQLKHDSGLTKAKQDTARWSAAIQPQLQQLAAATPAGTTLDGLHAHILALKATWDPLWEEYLKPRWRRQRLALHHAQDRVIEAFCKKVVNGMKWVSRQHYHQERGVAVFLGAGNFSQGGWKAGAVRAGFRKVVEQPSRPSTDPRPDRLVIVDEFRTTRVSSSVHARQPCELHLPPNQPRPADWVPPAGQVNHRLLRPAWSLRHAKCVRGLKWCHERPQAPPWGRWLDRDTNPCLNFQRIGESKQRPLELCRWTDLEALPPIGKEYHQRYKLVNDRLPKVKQRLHRAAEYLRGIDGRAHNNA
ncbi:hypothetical protein QJQ45_016148 [Haematococcus lacustris]|nr:hypothetical protein QJQ45_016148 [Haematococcus lacustris]